MKTETQATQLSAKTINKIHLEFQTYGSNAKHWLRKCQLMIPEIDQHRVWEAKGFTSLYHYAAVVAGMSRNSVNEAIRVHEKIRDKPALIEVAKKYGINRIKPVVTIATKETEGFWANKVEKMGNNALQTYVREYKRQGLHMQGQRVEGEKGNLSKQWGEGYEKLEKKVSMYLKLDVEIVEKLKKLKGDGDFNQLIEKMLEAYEENQAAEQLEEEKPKSVNTGKRYVPVKIKKYVTNKTSGCCAYPGCTKEYEILHHTKRFALDSTHSPDTLVPLCKSHERLAHAGLVMGEDGKVEYWKIGKEVDIQHPKYQVDKVVRKYYARK